MADGRAAAEAPAAPAAPAAPRPVVFGPTLPAPDDADPRLEPDSVAGPVAEPGGVSEAAAAGEREPLRPAAPEASGVARQVARAILDAQDRDRIELRLDPPELGDVSIELTLDDRGGVSAVVTAERAETLDLLRRHADLLGRQLSEMGFARADLSFGAGGGQENRPAAQGRAIFIDAGAPEASAAAAFGRRVGDRLDIRL